MSSPSSVRMGNMDMNSEVRLCKMCWLSVADAILNNGEMNYVVVQLCYSVHQFSGLLACLGQGRLA